MGNLSNEDLRRMEEYARSIALRAAKLAIDDKVPISLSDGAHWATLANFLRGELVDREGV